MCAVIAATLAAAMRRQLGQAILKVRTIELRLDWLASGEEINRFLDGLESNRPKGVTLIATCRRREAGGRFAGSIGEELFYLARAIGAGCEWCDLPVESAEIAPPELLDVCLAGGKRLISAHFFHSFPRNLPTLARRLERSGADAIKIAAQCDSYAQAAELLKFASKRKSTIAIPMGEVALPVRILALRKRDGFAYAPIEAATAPGQVGLDETIEMYRADKLDPATQVYGVIGDPIGHSLSPVMQNAGFRARRMNAVYVPFLVRDLKDFMGSLEALCVKGLSVTIPHKENVLHFLDDCDPLAERIGAVNTVVVRGGGELYGYNTDYVGVLRSLEERIPLRGSRVLIVGAGGVARAVAFALAQAGATVSIWARRSEQARQLARATCGEVIARQQIRSEFFDATINTTPVGMYPQVGESPLAANELNCRLVFDTIYRPRKTQLLRLAEKRGIETVSGVEMFVAQGVAQWEIWTGERAPVDAMRRIVDRALAAEERRPHRKLRERR